MINNERRYSLHNQRKPMSKMIPICWKCARAIVEDNEDGSKLFTGCMDNKSIHSYEGACEACSLIHDEIDQDFNALLDNIGAVSYVA